MAEPKDTVIITGSSGFIGSAVVNELAGRFRLVGLDKIAHRTPPPAAEGVCIDLTDESAITSAFERVRVAYGDRIASVIHLAAALSLPRGRRRAAHYGNWDALIV